MPDTRSFPTSPPPASGHASLFLVHGTLAPTGVSAGDEVVALTPMGLDACAAAGLRPTVLDDHFDRSAILTGESDHVRWELDWLDRLADVGGDAARTAALYIVTPLDALILAAWLLYGLVDAIGPARVVYVGPTRGTAPDPVPFHAGHLQFCPRFGDAPLASRLLPLLARQLGLAYDEVPTSWPSWPNESGNAAFGGRHGRWLASRLASTRNTWSGRAHGMVGSRHPNTCATLACWATGYGARGVIAEERRQGRRLLILARGGPSTRLLAPSLIGPRSASPAIPVATVVDDAALPPAWRVLLDEVEQRAGIDGAGLLLESRLRYYLSAIAPAVGRAADALRPELKRHNVTSVVAANPSSIEEYATLLAARQAGVQASLYQHGDHLMTYEPWFSTELQNFDRLHASDVSLLNDIPETARRLAAPCPAVVVSSPRVEQLRQRRRPAPAGAFTCYLPMFLLADGATVGSGAIDDAWYHRWHLTLLAVMAAHGDTQFIWKGLPTGDYAPDPLTERLRGGELANVRYDTRPFQAVLAESGRIICDFPSTGLYEAIHQRRPVLALVFPRFVTVRPRGAALLHPALRTCHDTSDAVAEVERFLEADPKEYLVNPDSIYRSPRLPLEGVRLPTLEEKGGAD